ncbi:MAG: MGMT family protein [Verrucomicrobiota bacterium]
MHQALNDLSDKTLCYGCDVSPFGDCVVGLCCGSVAWLSFHPVSEGETALPVWSYGPLVHRPKLAKEWVGRIFDPNADSAERLELLLQGTPFQTEVWSALQAIPRGETRTYAQIAAAVGRPRASRAVGTAIGSNPVSFLVPCHRVLRTDGSLGGYRWGVGIKQAILSSEGVELPLICE